MPLDRRTFLSGATTVAALGAAGLPRVAFASTDEGVELGARVMGLRRRWAAERQDYLDSMFSERASAESSDLTPFTLALGNGLGALSTYKDLEEVPVEEQMHPRFQELILDVAEGLGGMLVSCRELLEHFLDGADADPLREAHLRASLRSVRLSLSEWRTTGARQKSLEHGLLEIEREPEPGALLRRVRHQVARLKRAEVLADQVAANWEQSDVLRVADPALLARMDEGRARWAAAGVDAGVQADDGTGTSYGGGVPVDEETHSRGVHRLVLGIVVLGVGCLVGAVLVLVGGCALACSGGVGAALVMLAGLAVLGLALWLGLSLIFKGRAMMKGHGVAEAELLGPKAATAVRAVPVVAEETWVPTGVRRGADRVVLVEGAGMVRSPSGWMADADGNGTIAGDDALVPGAPVCALVGRVGAESFYLGTLGQVPPGLAGELELAVNRDGPEGLKPKGHFVVKVTVMESAAVG